MDPSRIAYEFFMVRRVALKYAKAKTCGDKPKRMNYGKAAEEMRRLKKEPEITPYAAFAAFPLRQRLSPAAPRASAPRPIAVSAGSGTAPVLPTVIAAPVSS
jgi:hypothetical protein